MEPTLFQAAQSGLSHRPSFHEESGSDLKRCPAGGSPKASVIAATIAEKRFWKQADGRDGHVTEEDRLPLVQAHACMVHSWGPDIFSSQNPR